MKFQIYLVDERKTNMSSLSWVILELTTNEYNTVLICDTRELISSKFELLKDHRFYNLFIKKNGEFQLPNCKDLFSLHVKEENQCYFSHFSASQLNDTEEKELELKKKELELKEKEYIRELELKEKDYIRLNLKISLKDPKCFKAMIGDLEGIKYKKELMMPPPFELSNDVKKELEQFAYVLKKINTCRIYECEAEKHIIVSEILATSISFLNSFYFKAYFMRDEFVIKPDFTDANEKDIVRKVDIVIMNFEGTNPILICLCEIKPEDCDECLRQNADQMRVYCFSFNKRFSRGIATNGQTWYFTQYEKKGEKFIVSKSFDFIQFSNKKFNGFLNQEEFFGILIAYIAESQKFMDDNNK